MFAATTEKQSGSQRETGRRPLHRRIWWAGALAVAVALALPAGAPAQVSFRATNIPAGDGPFSVAVADFNRDSDPDLAVANWNSTDISMLLGAARSSFGAAKSFASGGSRPSSVAAGDFNADSYPDMAVTNHESSTVSVLLGGEGGALGAPTTYGTAPIPQSVAMGDFNADDHPDLAVASRSGGVTVLLGEQGGGTFKSATSSDTGGLGIGSIAVGDFNGDTDPDLAVANSNSDNVSVLLGGQDGTFGGATNFAAGDGPSDVAVGDFNGDKDPDLAVTNESSDNVSVLLGGQDGTFGGATNFAAGDWPHAVAVADFNGDDKPDLAIGNMEPSSLVNNVHVRLGTGDGSFGGAAIFRAGYKPASIAVGDFDRDTDPDLAVANNGSDNVSVLVNNDPPTAATDGYATAEDTPLNVAAPGVLGNDSDPDGDSLTAALVSGPDHGTLTLRNNGSFEYRPNADYSGPDSFSYRASDGALSSEPATVAIDVKAAAETDRYELFEDDSLNVEAPGVLANDNDAQGDGLTALLASFPAHGDLTLREDGSFDYTPYRDYSGPDSFTYRVSGGGLDSKPVTVTLDVEAQNDRPVASNDVYEIGEDTLMAIQTPGLLDNDSDIDGDSLTPELVSGPQHGRLLEFRSNGSFWYMPDGDYHGSDSFTYRVRDPDGWDSDPVTVGLYVHPRNDGPRAEADSYTTDEDKALTVEAAGVLANDSDPEGDSFTAELVYEPPHGSVELRQDGSFTYTPNGDYNGTDSFTYVASDGQRISYDTTVTLDVKPVDDRPTAEADRYSTDEDKPLNVAAPGVLGNDSDVDGELVAAKVVSGPAHGSLTMNADGSFEYVPERAYNGSDSFSYHANDDGDLASDEATVTIDVAPVDDPPAGTGPASTPPAGATPAAGSPAGSASPAEAAVTQLRLRPRCVRPSRSGKVRVQARLRMTRPAPVQVRIDRVVGTKLRPGCRSAKPGRRFRKAATLRRLTTRQSATGRRLALKLRLAPGLYRITVRAHLDRNRLSSPAQAYLRVLG